jgi:hypothetical protein
MRNITLSLILSVVFSNCTHIDCAHMEKQFSSYREAESQILKTSFDLTDRVNTSESSWVRGASYYSCDKRMGYFILKTDSGNYVHKNLPLGVWKGFKKAKSFGSYYDALIKNRYQLDLIQR